MKARKETIRRAVENGSMDRVNRLVSAAHLLNCEANGLIEETADILRENGLLLGELKKYHSDFVKCADRYFREFAVMVADDRRKMDMFEDMDEFDRMFREWAKIDESKQIRS
ncbi:MAG: hypothetical protein IAB08_07755 [Bacteroidetes bacterium]|uniref:Uncharacterized protein n=1 Tax=Candidatus Pullibacteroides excrementavium TaxID=2840905 RepID=A0A9D9DXL4_9BACT|nr:hypothetical protein [Candidatus Pullibacteroides excrementavium]